MAIPVGSGGPPGYGDLKGGRGLGDDPLNRDVPDILLPFLIG